MPRCLRLCDVLALLDKGVVVARRDGHVVAAVLVILCRLGQLVPLVTGHAVAQNLRLRALDVHDMLEPVLHLLIVLRVQRRLVKPGLPGLGEVDVRSASPPRE